ncbi:MAG TPA: diphthine--ammonia ligase [Candidatus Nanoarchaeia archaeon]|nr:diphthine--ammonia ligase [Candidatus Nanoarchaeia archaeon]
MKVAVLYSGGKDSTYAIQFCREKGWDVRYLLSVKPTRKDCFLFHYATVEHTRKTAEMLGIRHRLISCSVADPVQEALLIQKVVAMEEKVDAVVLGGTGLQETQINSIKRVLAPLGIDAFAAHAGRDHAEVFAEMLEQGYEVMITQVASDGLMQWLGTIITKANFPQLLEDSKRYGFHSGFEGGYADSFVLDCPLFSKRVELAGVSTIIDDAYCGHIIATTINLVDKNTILEAVSEVIIS